MNSSLIRPVCPSLELSPQWGMLNPVSHIHQNCLMQIFVIFPSIKHTLFLKSVQIQQKSQQFMRGGRLFCNRTLASAFPSLDLQRIPSHMRPSTSQSRAPPGPRPQNIQSRNRFPRWERFSQSRRQHSAHPLPEWGSWWWEWWWIKVQRLCIAARCGIGNI